MMGNARSDEFVTFARSAYQALAVKYRYLLSATLNQARLFEFPGSVGNARPLDTQHFSQQVLGNGKCVIVAAVSHHKQPTGETLLEVVRTVARGRHHDLFEERVEVGIYQ